MEIWPQVAGSEYNSGTKNTEKYILLYNNIRAVATFSSYVDFAHYNCIVCVCWISANSGIKLFFDITV